MWILENQTPFSAERCLKCDQNGADTWIVAVKGTFLIHENGKLELAPKQEPVSETPEFFDDPLKTGLRYECDLEYAKPTTDIILHGHAYSPQQKPITSLDITLKLGKAINKTLRIIGDRTWEKTKKEPRLTAPQPFIKMPLVYERSFGGADLVSQDPEKQGYEPYNPIGTGFSLEPDHIIGQKAPNIEDPKTLIQKWDDRPKPIGFGPLARHWSPRKELAGTYDEKWKKERFPLYPHDFNACFFQFAPEDQQTAKYLLGGEPVELLHLTPQGTLKFNLPEIGLSFTTKLAGETIDHPARIQTVILEPDMPRVIMIWHTAVPCHNKKLKLEQTRIFEKRYL